MDFLYGVRRSEPVIENYDRAQESIEDTVPGVLWAFILSSIYYLFFLEAPNIANTDCLYVFLIISSSWYIIKHSFQETHAVAVNKDQF